MVGGDYPESADHHGKDQGAGRRQQGSSNATADRPCFDPPLSACWPWQHRRCLSGGERRRQARRNGPRISSNGHGRTQEHRRCRSETGDRVHRRLTIQNDRWFQLASFPMPEGPGSRSRTTTVCGECRIECWNRGDRRNRGKTELVPRSRSSELGHTESGSTMSAQVQCCSRAQPWMTADPARNLPQSVQFLPPGWNRRLSGGRAKHPGTISTA